MPDQTLRDWDDAYANMAYVPGAAALLEQWAAEAARYRLTKPAELDIVYGEEPRAQMDLFWPEGTPKGLVVFVHGGYWMRLSKADWSHLAEGGRAAGWAVCLPSYTLAPEASIAQITRQIAQAITVAASLVPGPIRLAGHSAGGHLVSRMNCADALLPAEVFERVEHTLSLSGVHDLRPLMKTQMNDVLKLDLAEARTESPALCEPLRQANLTCWVGGGERPEFIRQSRLMAQIWEGFEAAVRCEVEGDLNHFTVTEALRLPGSPLTRCLLES